MTKCPSCGADLGGQVLRGEVLGASELVVIFGPKLSRTNANRWLAGGVLSGEKTPRIRGRWVSVKTFEADMARLGCGLKLATGCLQCGASLNGYLIRPELFDGQDIVDFFGGRVSLESAHDLMRHKVVRGRKTRGIRGYWTTYGDFHSDLRRAKQRRARISPRVITDV